jgi:hypothetical protein
MRTISSPDTFIPLYLPHTDPALSLFCPPLAPIHLIQTNLAQTLAPFAFLGPSVFIAIAASRAAFRRICGGWGVDVFAVNILRFRDKSAATISSAGVSLLQAEELDLLREEVEEIHHCERCVVDLSEDLQTSLRKWAREFASSIRLSARVVQWQLVYLEKGESSSE